MSTKDQVAFYNRKYLQWKLIMLIFVLVVFSPVGTIFVPSVRTFTGEWFWWHIPYVGIAGVGLSVFMSYRWQRKLECAQYIADSENVSV